MKNTNHFLGIIKIVTGERGAGKTSFCAALSKGLQKRKIKVKGVLSPGIFEEGQKKEIWAEDIFSSNRKLLGVSDPGWDPTYPKRQWQLAESTIKWGNEIINQSTPADVLFIDELGYLEFEKKSGWISAFDVLDEKEFHFAFIVVRPQLVPHAKNRFGGVDIITIEDVNKNCLLQQTYLELIQNKLDI